MTLLLVLPTSGRTQGRLEQVRHDVRTDNEDDDGDRHDRRKRSRDRRYPYSHDDDEDSILGDILGGIISGLFSSASGAVRREPPEFDPSHDHTNRWQQQIHPEAAPASMGYHPTPPNPAENSQWPPKVESYFAHYPYADGHDGYMFFEKSAFRPEAHGASFWFEYGSDFEGLERWTGKLLWEHGVGWSVDGEWSFLSESLGQSARARDELHLGDVNVLMRLITAESAQWFVGAGLNWLADRRSADFGFNMTSRLNAFPIRPLILTAEVDYGWLGSADQFHGMLGVGAIWNHLELFAGYDYRRIGSVEFLGPSFGARYWW